jgi:peptide/nickel transport system substrate-binding protein
MNPKNNVFHREGYDRVARIDTPDDLTVVVHLKTRYPPFVTKFFTSLQEGAKVILPEHLLAKLPDINRAPFNAAPIGSGPFKFVSWDRGRGVSFVRNDDYFKGRPKLERIEFRVIPDDATILSEMQIHDIDMTVGGVAPSLYERYRTIDGLKTQLYPWNGMSVLSINDGQPGLRHVEVRRAIATAIDYGALITKVTHGVGTIAHDIVPPVALGYTDNPPYRYDPRAARALLDAAGWKPGPDGIRAKGGERLEFVLLYPAGSAGGRAIGVQLQAELQQIGIGISIKTSPYNVIFSYDGPIVTRHYDLALYSYTLPWDPDNLAYLGCDQFSPKGENSFAYCDRKVDAGERAGLATDDPVRRAAIYHPVERRIHETVPYIPLYLLRRPTAINTDLRNFSAAPGIVSWWNAWEWSL